jgi:hypothetical protein
MKTKTLIFILLLLVSLILKSQTYMLGYQNMSAHDDSRDRDISTIVYYPSDVGGETAAISDGVFPAIIFGHGTAMADETLYDYIYEALVSEGYIVMFPTTEDDSPPLGAPNHEAFGLDLQYLNFMIKFENMNSGSFFFGHVSDRTAIIGHSLGGKGTLIAAANNTEVTTIVTLCAALSDPPIPYSSSGYDAINNSLPYVTVPSLVIDTEFDCVVPEDEGQHLTYELLDVDCKTYVNIIGGGHCYMASHDGSSCETAEGWLGGNCSDDFTITREEQNNIVIDLLLPYFNYMLKDDVVSMNEFLNYISTSTDVSSERYCVVLSCCKQDLSPDIDIYPNPSNGILKIDLKSDQQEKIEFYDINGCLLSSFFVAGHLTVNLDYLANGIYFVRIKNRYYKFSVAK